MSDKVDFGALTGIESADILQESDLPSSGVLQDRQLSAEGSPLWEYHTLGTINGIEVQPDSKGLKIDSIDLLMAAMQLVAMPRVFVCWIAPEDEAGQKEYTELLEKAGNRRIIIDEEARQYDSAKSAYMVLVRYSEVSYRLHPRFDYIRSEDHE